MLGDIAVAVNPKDKRFTGLVGKNYSFTSFEAEKFQ